MTEPISYTTIEEFPLKWRFAEDSTKWTVLPPSDLACFKPLATDSARRLWPEYVSNAAEQLMEIVTKTVSPDRNQFGTRLLVIDDNWSSEEEHQRVAKSIRQKIDIVDSAILYFFWDASCAVETTWDILLRYWSDFCYPSDDSNVAVVLEAKAKLYYIEGTVWLSQSPQRKHAI